MVSNIEFFSVKLITVKGMNPKIRIAVGGLIALTWYNSGFAFLVLSAAYVLSGPYKIWKLRKAGSVNIA